MELLIAAAIFLIAIAALFWASFSQRTLNEHSRNLSWAINDASRVIERLRQQNRGSGCATPSAAWPAGSTSWDNWLDTAGGGKSLPVGAGEVVAVNPSGGPDPIQVTVAVCWQHRSRQIGTCAAFTSPAMLTTTITCRG